MKILVLAFAALVSSSLARAQNTPGGPPAMQNLRIPELQTLPVSFGLGPANQPKKAWTQKSDRKFGVVHFKFVVP